MNDPDRQRLILKLKNKELALQHGLENLRNEFERPDVRAQQLSFGEEIWAEIELITNWVMDFTEFALDTARSISLDHQSLTIVNEHVAEMLERFDPHVKTSGSMLLRSEVGRETQWRTETVTQGYSRARSRVHAMLAEAAYNFLPAPEKKAGRPTYAEVVAWCRQWITDGKGNGMDKAWVDFKAEPAHRGLDRDNTFRVAWREVKGLKPRV